MDDTTTKSEVRYFRIGDIFEQYKIYNRTVVKTSQSKEVESEVLFLFEFFDGVSYGLYESEFMEECTEVDWITQKLEV